MTRVTLTTANTPGAVAILQLHASDVASVLQDLTGRTKWVDRRAYLVPFADIDEGLAIRIDGQAAQLMPHGGPRVIQRLLDHLTNQLGCAYDPAPNALELYPEANSPIEADMLDAIARATSPAAIDLLAQQPSLWLGLCQQAGELDQAQRQAILSRSQTLNHLLTPPTVVVAGPANVGKSTLTNALMGKRMSIVADLPGTTRDWVGGLVELGFRGWDFGQGQQRADPDTPNPQSPTPKSQIAVNWLDTPGLRESEDTIEQRAIALAKQQIEQAHVLIAMRDPDQPWPDTTSLPRKPDLFVINKVDDATSPDSDAGRSPEHPLAISASQEINLDHLQMIILNQLGLIDLPNKPWAFTKKLLAWCETGEQHELANYLKSISTV